MALVQSQIADMSLIAPFDGIVGSVNPKVGEAFSASVPAIDVLSKGNYKIDIMIPENEIGGVAAGSQAVVTFDAYGLALEATATVATVDISETMTNGIGAYKATLYLNGSDSRIRTGMTGNVTIQGPSANSVLAIPTSAVISESGSSFALVGNTDGSFAKRQIQTGLSGGGWTEVRSGLSAGNIVAAFGNSFQ
jgi:RND family efflux transporter MFP subunit